MSHFPSVLDYCIKNSRSICNRLEIVTPFVLKKTKGVYLYDIDQNKYVDFSLQDGELFAHAPRQLTCFIKNALSYGINSGNIPNRLFLKAIGLWRHFFQISNVTCYPHYIFAILECCSLLSKNNITVGYNSTYIKQLLTPLSNIFKLYDISHTYTQVDIIVFEHYSDYYDVWNPPLESTALKIKIHSRFLSSVRHHQSINPFNDDYIHIIHSIPFSGKPLSVMASQKKILTKYLMSFDESILLIEGLKYLERYLEKKIIPFSNLHFKSFNRFAVCKSTLDTNYFLRYGIYLKDNVLFFSPDHSIHDMQRLNRALKIYFNEMSNDTLVQKPFQDT